MATVYAYPIADCCPVQKRIIEYLNTHGLQGSRNKEGEAFYTHFLFLHPVPFSLVSFFNLSGV